MQKDAMFLPRWSYCLSSLVGRAFGWRAVGPGIAFTCRFETLAAHMRLIHGPHNAKTRQIKTQTKAVLTLARFLYFATFPSGGGGDATPLAFGN